MALIFVTGISTSGKSAIAKELLRHGYEAYDTEHNGISAYYNKKTGERAAEFGQAPERTNEWLEQHEWLISIDWVKQMSKEAQDKPIFLCGGGSNESKVRALCQKIIWLQTDEATIRERVHLPRDHDYGTKPHELERAIAMNELKEAEYTQLGADIVDARRPFEEVLDDVIALGSYSA